MLACKEVNNGKWGLWCTQSNRGTIVPDRINSDEIHDLNYWGNGRESKASYSVHDEEMEGRGNWRREKQRCPKTSGQGHQNIAPGVQVLNMENYARNSHTLNNHASNAYTSTTDASFMEDSKNKKRVQFANGESFPQSHLVTTSEHHFLDPVSRNSCCQTSVPNFRGYYDGHGQCEPSHQLPFYKSQGDMCNTKEESNDGEVSQQGPIALHQCIPNKPMHKTCAACQQEFCARRDPTSLATGHLDWLWSEEPEGCETLHGVQNEHGLSLASFSLSKMVGRCNDHVKDLGINSMDDDLGGTHDDRVRVIGLQSRKSAGNETGQIVSGAWTSVDYADSARCSSMSLTDLVETSPKKYLKDLVHRERSTLASHLQLVGSSLGTKFCTGVRETHTIRPFSPSHSSLTTSSPSRRRNSARSSTSLSVCVPNQYGNTTTHGVLRCTLCAGLPNYTFLLDGYEEVVIAKIWAEDVMLAEDQGAWRYTFYSLKGGSKKNGRHGWKHWKKKEKLLSELVGKMRVSSVVHSEPAALDRGENVSVESEFVLYNARAHNPSVNRQVSFSSPTTSSLETLSHGRSKASHTLVNTSSPPSQSRASSLDGGFSDVSSSGAISAWYVSRSLIPISLGSPDLVRPKSGKWSLHSGIPTMRTTKAKKGSQQSPGLHANREEPSSGMIYSPSQPHTELAAMIINVPLELQDPLAGSMPMRVRDFNHNRVGGQPNELEHRTSDGALEPQSHRIVDYNHRIKHKRHEHRDANITVILPTGSHGKRLCDSKGPSPLIQRWKEGGKCDCKGWDLDCGLLVLNNEQPRILDSDSKPSTGRDQQGQQGKQGRNNPLKLYRQNSEFEEPYLSLAPQENGLIAIGFQAPLTPLQALATVVAILHGRSGAPDMEISHNILSMANNADLHAQGKGVNGEFSAFDGSSPCCLMLKSSEGTVGNGNTSPLNGDQDEPCVKNQVNDVFSCVSKLALSFERV